MSWLQAHKAFVTIATVLFHSLDFLGHFLHKVTTAISKGTLKITNARYLMQICPENRKFRDINKSDAILLCISKWAICAESTFDNSYRKHLHLLRLLSKMPDALSQQGESNRNRENGDCISESREGKCYFFLSFRNER